jgi:hypothetical protein
VLQTLAVAVVPVALGVAVAYVPRLGERVVGLTRVVALVAALVVVLVVLLPDAAAVLGPEALVGFSVGALGPVAVDRGWKRLRRRLRPAEEAAEEGAHHHEHGLGVEVAFGGLLLHQVVEGFELGALGPAGIPLPLVLAIAAHTTPLVAAAVLGFALHDGRRSANLRALALIGVSAAGVAAGTVASAGWPPTVSAWIQAVLAGLLLHLLGHDLREQRAR